MLESHWGRRKNVWGRENHWGRRKWYLSTTFSVPNGFPVPKRFSRPQRLLLTRSTTATVTKHIQKQHAKAPVAHACIWLFVAASHIGIPGSTIL